MENFKNKKIIIYFLIFILLLIIILGLLFRSGIINWNQLLGQVDSEKNVATKEGEFSESTFLDEKNANEVDLSKNGIESSLLKSENYKIKQINLGGSAVTKNSDSEELQVVIGNLQSEALLSADNKEAKLLISWETNKEVLSSVEYSQSSGQNSKKAVEGRHSSTHRLVLSGLDPGVVYIYQITSQDRWGKEFISEYYSVFSGSPAVSVFDLISKSMNEIFGWAIKK